MTVSEKDVARVAELANLELTSEEKSRMLHDLNAILDHIAQLNELDTTAVPPMAQVGEYLREGEGSEQIPEQGSEQGPEQAPHDLRADEPMPSLSRDQVLAYAPDTDRIYFRVPKVIDR